tara:strand:- start:6402 stop:6584 length:183 start_codon:yes stop_codon:yes gene_type:complete
MLTNEKHELARELVSQMLDKAVEEDRLHKINAIENHKASQAIGDSWWVHHLKALDQLLSQ